MAYLVKRTIKRIIRAILCLFSVIFIMSHNAGALSLTEDVNLIRGNMQFIMTCMNCSNFNDQFFTDEGTVIWANNNDIPAYIRVLKLTTDYETYAVGDYLQLNIYIWNNINNNSSDAVVKSIRSNTSGWDLVDVSVSSVSAGSGVISITLKCYTAGTYTQFDIGSTTSNFITLYPQEYIATSVATHWRPKGQVDIQSVVNAINSQPNYQQQLNNIGNKIDSLKNSIDNQNEEEQDAVQDASDAADTAANENSSNAATTNLIGVISNFISAITNFSGSDCNITLAFPSYAGGSMIVNVCQNKDKAGNIISVFTSLSLIVFYLPLAFKLLSMIYNEIRSFTNG